MRVFISMGGSTSTYGLNSTSMAQSVAIGMWNLFLGGTSTSRPFGSAVLDGVDLDIEQGGSNQIAYYGDFVTTLKEQFGSSSKKYYIS